MKATGIVRRIDDLGRVVIPKEIRRTMRIREGDPLLTTLTVRTLSGRLEEDWTNVNGSISLLPELKFMVSSHLESASSPATSARRRTSMWFS